MRHEMLTLPVGFHVEQIPPNAIIGTMGQDGFIELNDLGRQLFGNVQVQVAGSGDPPCDCELELMEHMEKCDETSVTGIDWIRVPPTKPMPAMACGYCPSCGGESGSHRLGCKATGKGPVAIQG